MSGSERAGILKGTAVNPSTSHSSRQWLNSTHSFSWPIILGRSLGNLVFGGMGGRIGILSGGARVRARKFVCRVMFNVH